MISLIKKILIILIMPDYKARLYRIFTEEDLESKKSKVQSLVKIFLKKNKINNKKKILIIPSWYPTTNNPHIGTFFREQSLLMTSKYDVRILFGQPKENLNELFTKSCDDLISLPEELLFNYKVDAKNNEYITLSNMFSSYNVILNELTCQGWKPDLIHAHCSVYGGIVANYLGKSHNIPTMITEHQVFLLNNYSKLLQDKIFNALEETNFVGAVSTDKMKFILMHGIKCNPVVLGNMVDDSIFKIKHKKRKNKKFNILIVAGASFIKDLPTFFYSIKELIDKNHNNIHAKIVGNGTWGNENYSELIKKLKLEKYCTFVDIVERKEMPKFYQESDVFVSTSIAEGFQVSILEAMACGKPVVSTSHGGAEDIISPENGIIVKIRDYKSIAEALINIKTGKFTYNSEIIRSTVVSQYGRKAFRKKISKIYDSLIKK